MADMLICGHYVCYANPDTSEVEIIFDNEMLYEYGISWDDEEDDEEVEDELYNNVKAQMARIYSWERRIRIEKPESYEAFGFMEKFVNEVIPEGKLKEEFWRALSRRHPFRNFNAIVHECKYREDWFAFRQEAFEEYVRRELGITE